VSHKNNSVVFIKKNKVTKRFRLYSITKSSTGPQNFASLCVLLFINFKNYEVHQNYRSDKFRDAFRARLRVNGRIRQEN
jgi:hypothetical protein